MIRCIDVLLTIPDNEAGTALATLQRLGATVAGLERSDLYRCEVEPAAAPELPATLRGLETIFNPNKHVLRERESNLPRPGEVWIARADGDDAPLDGPVRVGGRLLRGVRSLQRLTAWRLFDAAGEPMPPSAVAAATETLLCNPAFQKAIVYGETATQP